MATVYDLLDPATDPNPGSNQSFSDPPADTIPNLVNVTGSVGGDAIFTYIPNGGGDTSGTGQFPSFLRIQDKPTEDGFNTDTPNGTLDDVPSVVHTHSLLQNTLATVTLSGTDYYEFRLDMGQTGSSPNIVLDQLKIYTSNAVATLADYTAATQSLGAGFTLAYDLGASSVLLTAHNSGNGHDDYYIYIPKADFNLGDSYITFYAQFGGLAGYNSNGTFEEFSAVLTTGTPVTGQGDFFIAKDYGLTAGDYNNTDVVTAANQTIYYEITVGNTGTDALTFAELTDSILDAQGNLTGPVDDIGGDGILSVGETWHFYASHVVTQDEMNNWGNGIDPGYIDNFAYGTFTDGAIQIGPYPAEAQTPIVQTPGISIAKHTWAGTTNIDYKDVLAGTAISWTYDVTNTGNVSLANPTVTDDHLVTITPLLLGDGHNTGDSNDNGVFDPNEVWHYTASGFAVVGQYNNTGEATDSFTGGDGTTTPLDVTSNSGYFGDNPIIKIDKVTTGKDIGGVSHTGDGINISEGTSVTWTYTVTNPGNVGLTNVTVTDNVSGVTPHATLAGDGYNVGDLTDKGVLDPGEIWVFTASGLAIAGTYNNTGTANGSFTDSIGQSVTVHDTDASSYVGQFHQGTPGLTIGYWYNHTTQTKADPDHHWASEAYVTGYGWGILLGDYTGTDALGSSIAHPLSAAWALAHGELFIPDAAAIQLINSSQSANDTRQTLLSQAIAAQLNINSGDRDPGYNGTAASITHNLISEAVQWLEGVSPYTTGGRIDTNGDGILSTGITNAFEYNTKTTAFTSPVLASSQPAWQLQQTYSAADYHPVGNGSAAGAGTAFSADGEGLKNALQAFNQDHLVTTPDGQYVAWDQAGTNTPSTVYTDISLNGANDFWSILHIEAHNAVNTSSLHGIL